MLITNQSSLFTSMCHVYGLVAMKHRLLQILIMLLITAPVFGQKENHEKSSGQFEYIDCGCSGKIDLKLYDGLYGSYGGDLVPNNKEWSEGGLTVANLNDSDGDGTIDNGDMVVKTIGGVNGSRDEVDLMKLEVTSTGNFPPKCQEVELVLEGPIEIWNLPTKESIANRVIPISSLPITVWVEAQQASAEVADIEIHAKVKGKTKDKVKATAVWVQFERKYLTKGVGDNPSPATLGIDEPTLVNLIENIYKDNLDQRYGIGPSSEFNQLLYSGTCPTAVYNGINAGYNAILMTEYHILPDNLKDIPGMLGVKFDFARQLDADENIIKYNGFMWEEHPIFPDEVYGDGIEGSNDDGENLDEDLTPSMFNKIYSYDAPGFSYHNNTYFDCTLGGIRTSYYHRNLDFKEFARVSFNAQPEGDGLVQGSRCSNYVEWDTEYTVNRKSLSGAADPFDGCNQGFFAVTSALSHSDPVRLAGAGVPDIEINLLPDAADALYILKYLGTLPIPEWELRRGDVGGSALIGTFPLNAATNNWTVLDPGKVELTISNDPSLVNGVTFVFTVSNEASVANSLN